MVEYQNIYVNILILIKEIQGEPLIQILLLQAQMYVALIAFHNAIRDWNSLPISIKNVNNKEAFKNAVKELLKIEARRREENEYFYFVKSLIKIF